jgi:hypothetical protein
MHTYEVHTHEMRACEVHAHEVHAYEVHAREVHACEMHVYEVHTHGMHACEVHGHEVHAYGVYTYHEVHSLHRYLDSPRRASNSPLLLPLLLFWSLEVTSGSAWTLPYTLACTVKSPSSPKGCCCCSYSSRPDPFTMSRVEY